MDFAGAVDAPDQDLLDVGRPAGAGDEHHGAAGSGAVRELEIGVGQYFVERAHKLVPPVKGDVDGRRERRHLDAFRGAAQHQGTAFRQHEIDTGNAGSGGKAGFGEVSE